MEGKFASLIIKLKELAIMNTTNELQILQYKEKQKIAISKEAKNAKLRKLAI